MNKLLILVFAVMMNYCENSLIDAKECSEDITCTQESRKITITVLDPNGKNVELDDHFTFIKETGKIIRYDDLAEDGVYTVLTDSEIKQVKDTGSNIIFRGSKNGEDIFYEFEIGRNCCHIIKLEGEEQVAFASKVRI